MSYIDRDINIITSELDFIKENNEHIPLERLFIKHEFQTIPKYKISVLCKNGRIDLSEYGSIGQIIDFIRLDLPMMYGD